MGVDIFPFSFSGKRISRSAVSIFRSSFFPLCLSRLLSLRGLMVAVTNYLGRAHDLPFLSLPDTFLPSHLVLVLCEKGEEKECICVCMRICVSSYPVFTAIYFSSPGCISAESNRTLIWTSSPTSARFVPA